MDEWLWHVDCVRANRSNARKSLRHPYMLECELLSPFVQLELGESYDFAYTWAATNIGVDGDERQRIHRCNALCCEVRPFAIAAKGELSGHFGIFRYGHCFVEFVDQRACPFRTVWIGAASPLNPFVLLGTVAIPQRAVSAVLALYTGESVVDAERVGELARVSFPAAT